MAPTHGDDVGQHAGDIADAIDRTARVIAARHRQFLDPQAVLARQEQRLDVEAKPIALLRHEDGSRGNGGEALEAALRVRQAGERDGLDHQVEGTAHHAP